MAIKISFICFELIEGCDCAREGRVSTVCAGPSKGGGGSKPMSRGAVREKKKKTKLEEEGGQFGDGASFKKLRNSGSIP